VEGSVPTYQYACTACGHQLEAVQSFSDDPLTECPECEGRLRKLYSAVGIVFKGSGFYRTDSRNGGKTGGSSKPAESKGETKTETKSETKSETSSSSSSSSASSSSSSSSKSPAPAA
jgi:putative FmdB family regulatory protein